MRPLSLKRLAMSLAAACVAGMLIGSLVYFTRSSPQTSVQRVLVDDSFQPQSLEELAAMSAVIVRGRLAEQPREIAIVSPSETAPGAGERLIVLAYVIEPLEVLKGETELGQADIRVYSIVGAEIYGPGVAASGGKSTSAQLDSGHEYVWFMNWRGAVIGASGEMAGRHLAPATSPWVARVDGSSLTLEAQPTVDWWPGSLVSANRAAASIHGKQFTLQELRDAAKYAVLIPPVEDPDEQNTRERGEALTRLVEELPRLGTAEAVLLRVRELGLDANSLGDPDFCRKVEASIAQFGSQQITLACDSSAP